MKKVSIVGTHGVGKTTLVDEVYGVVEQEMEVTKIREQSMEWIEHFGFDWQYSNPHHYGHYEKALLHYFMFSFLLPTNFIADRSPFDVLAYAQLLCPMEDIVYIENEITNLLPYLKTIDYYMYIGDADSKDKMAVQVQNNLLEIFDGYGMKASVTPISRDNYDVAKEHIIQYMLD